ncbi:hypothetical protein LTR85_012246 [Meristemomyces frigidus]|nr:hypothetical protein LTR85_012246 [Meristemomyces frigidus]
MSLRASKIPRDCVQTWKDSKDGLVWANTRMPSMINNDGLGDFEDQLIPRPIVVMLQLKAWLKCLCEAAYVLPDFSRFLREVSQLLLKLCFFIGGQQPLYNLHGDATNPVNPTGARRFLLHRKHCLQQGTDSAFFASMIASLTAQQIANAALLWQ